jgi:hypothetical protein
VQELELWLLVAAVLAVVVGAAMRTRATLTRRPLAVGAMLGIIPGILGAVVVLVPRTDLVPDAAEPYLWILIALLSSGAVIVALTIGVVRR